MASSDLNDAAVEGTDVMNDPEFCPLSLGWPGHTFNGMNEMFLTCSKELLVGWKEPTLQFGAVNCANRCIIYC